MIDVSEPYRLDIDVLPESGRLNLWLERRPLSVVSSPIERGTRYSIDITYQILGAIDRAQRLRTPEIKLTLLDNGKALTKAVPSWGFGVSPLISGNEHVDGTEEGLWPDEPPPRIPVRPYAVRFLLAIGALLALVGYLTWRQWGLPWTRRRRGPFARACGQLVELGRQDLTELAYQRALECLHDAFNTSAGWAVFESRLDDFFGERWEFQPARAQVEAFYRESGAIFFAGAVPVVSLPERWNRLMDLARRCRRLERARP